MADYAVNMQRTASSTLSVGYVAAPASAMRRIKLFYASLGSEGVPADVANLWTLQRFTAIGTATAATPLPFDPADAASAAVGGSNSTVDPTYTAGAILLNVPLNQKATAQWWAPAGDELVIPATANNGLGLKTTVAGSSVAITGLVHFRE